MSDTLRDRLYRDLQQRALFLRAQAHAFDYADHIDARAVYPTPAALAALAHFDEPLPAVGGDGLELLDQLHREGAPASVAQTGGRYFGYVNGGVLPAAAAARWMADFWDQNAALHATSPINAKLEQVCQRWLIELLGLAPETVAGFVSGSSLATFCGLAAARYRLYQRMGWDVNRRGLYGAKPLRLIVGREAHGTVMKAIAMLGFGTDQIEWVETDDQGRMRVDRLPALDDRSILVLQAGNVCSGAFDDCASLCARAREAGCWTHIDGAFGLWVAACGELRHLVAGLELADSCSLDGHKTLNTPYAIGIALSRDSEALCAALHTSGSYIHYSGARDGMLYTPEMSRSARAVPLWAALKYLGRAGVDELVATLHQRALQFATALAASGFEVLNDVVFNQVLIACDGDARTEKVLHTLQQSGVCWAGSAHWRGRFVIRVSVCSWMTTEADVARSARAFAEAYGAHA